MIAGSEGKTPVAHAHGRSVEKSLPKSWAIGGKKPFVTSGFFRRARTLLVDLASFYLESNCMEFLLKSADNVTDYHRRIFACVAFIAHTTLRVLSCVALSISQQANVTDL